MEKQDINKTEIDVNLPIPVSEEFYKLAQNRTSNLLHKNLTKRSDNLEQTDRLGLRTIETSDFKLFIDEYFDEIKMKNSSAISPSAAILLDCLMIKATEMQLKTTLIVLPLREYMDMRGLSDIKATREQVNRDITALESISFAYKGTGKRSGAWLKVSISGGTVGQVKSGDIIFRFNQDFFNSFREYENKKYMYMLFPCEAMRGNIRQNPYKYWLARRIAEHKRMNLGKPNEDIIGVRTLIDSCPNYPTLADVMSGNRSVVKRIIKPFERDMNALSDSLNWRYNSKEADEDYDTFINSTVTIEWKNYPDISNLIQSKEARAEKIASDKINRVKKGGSGVQKKG
jgi:hypothetical protein